MSNPTGRRATDQSLIARAMQAARVELHGALLPILIALIAYLGNEKVNRIEQKLESVQVNTTSLAVITERSLISDRELDQVRAVARQNAEAHERVLITLKEHERRLDRFEARFDRTEREADE